MKENQQKQSVFKDGSRASKILKLVREALILVLNFMRKAIFFKFVCTFMLNYFRPNTKHVIKSFWGSQVRPTGSYPIIHDISMVSDIL